MCSHGATVVVEIDGMPRDVDSCIAPLVRALNDAGMTTVASCCGHGRRPGNIALADGRECVLARSYEEGRAIDALFPLDIHGVVVARSRLGQCADTEAAIEGMEPETACPHSVIVPIDADWGKCIACGDSTFPLSNSAAWGCDDGEMPHDSDDRQHDSAVAAYIRDLEAQRDAALAQVVKLEAENSKLVRDKVWAGRHLVTGGSPAKDANGQPNWRMEPSVRVVDQRIIEDAAADLREWMCLEGKERQETDEVPPAEEQFIRSVLVAAGLRVPDLKDDGST